MALITMLYVYQVENLDRGQDDMLSVLSFKHSLLAGKVSSSGATLYVQVHATCFSQTTALFHWKVYQKWTLKALAPP